MIEHYTQPHIAVWELTLQCNLHCLHCGSSAGQPRPNELTTTEALNLIHDLADLDFKGIALMGGEIFLRKDWTTIAQEIKNNNITLSIITNGYFSPTTLIPKLTKLEPECLMIGLDSAEPHIHDYIRGVKGAFNKTLSFIHAAKKAQLPVGIITTVHKKNFESLPVLREFIIDEEIDWQLQEATPIGRFQHHHLLSQEQYYALGLFIYNLQKKYRNATFKILGTHNFGFHSIILPNLSTYPIWDGCYAGKTVLGIQSNGDIKGCLALSDEYIEDNIRKRSIKDLWNDPNTFSYTRQFDPYNLGPYCISCKHSTTCKGGCTTRSSAITGIPHNDPYCFHRIEQHLHLKEHNKEPSP